MFSLPLLHCLHFVSLCLYHAYYEGQPQRLLGTTTAPNITFLSLLQRYFLCLRQRHRCFPEESKIIQSVGWKSDKNPANIWSNNSSQKTAVWITVIKFNLGSNRIWILLKDHLTFLLCHQCISNYRVSALRFADCLSVCKPHFKRQGLLEVFATFSGHFCAFFMEPQLVFVGFFFFQWACFEFTRNDSIWNILCHFMPLFLNFLLHINRQEKIH